MWKEAIMVPSCNISWTYETHIKKMSEYTISIQRFEAMTSKTQNWHVIN